MGRQVSGWAVKGEFFVGFYYTLTCTAFPMAGVVEGDWLDFHYIMGMCLDLFDWEECKFHRLL